jgi:hypothetical protein
MACRWLYNPMRSRRTSSSAGAVFNGKAENTEGSASPF